MTSATASAADPFDLTSAEIQTLSAEMTSLLTSSHPVLAKCAQYFFTASSGKKGESGGAKRVTKEEVDDERRGSETMLTRARSLQSGQVW